MSKFGREKKHTLKTVAEEADNLIAGTMSYHDNTFQFTVGKCDAYKK